MGEDIATGGKLSGLVVVLEGLVVVTLGGQGGKGVGGGGSRRVQYCMREYGAFCENGLWSINSKDITLIWVLIYMYGTSPGQCWSP